MEIVTFVELDIGDPIVTFRFGYASEEGLDYEQIPSLKSVSVRPAVLDPGESIGERESVSVSCIDHLHRFDTDEFDKGTFWTKFRARYPTIEGAPLRVIRGRRGQLISAMDTYLYVAEKFQLSRTGATITAKDPLTLLAAKAAQAPYVTQGELLAAISDVDMAFTLAPAGIGDLQYPAAGKGTIGGKEIVSFTRVADAVTLTSRGENTDPVEHDAGAKFQLALVYTGEPPSVIVNDLLVNYSSVDPAWITIADWQQAVDAFINRVYTAVIAEPTAVKKLLDELCEQLGLVFFWDPFAKQIRLRPLLATATTASITEEIMEDGSFSSVEQPDKRVSQIWTYYGQRDPVRPVSEPDNYRRIVIKIAPNELDFAQPAIRKIFSRWISFVGRSAAERLNDLIISRYQVPPRKFQFSLFRNKDFFAPPIGAHINVSHWFLVDGDGNAIIAPAQVTSTTHDDASLEYDAEEVRFAGEDLEPETDKYVFIESDVFNINLRDLYDQIFNPPNPGDNVFFVVTTGARVGSQIRPNYVDDPVPSMVVGDWPEAANLTLIINGKIQGIGGTGGGAEILGYDRRGTRGGTALYTRRAITVQNNGLGIWGGGGGGSVFPSSFAPGDTIDTRTHVGGGGAGFIGGASGNTPNPGQYYPVIVNGVDLRIGTETEGGIPDGFAANGGLPGEPATFPGDAIPDQGAAGIAIDGVSFITFTTVGTILGPQVN